MGRYEVDRRLGVGGMAEVFLARRVGTAGFARTVALKRVAPGLSSDARFAELFVEEAKLAALLTHPNIVAVLDFDRDDEGALFLAMEYVDGADLSRLIAELRTLGQAFPPGLAAYVAAEALRGLAHAHALVHEGAALGLVHRDMSPHNVLVGRAGTVKVADFGIAKAMAAAVHTGSIRGKLAYMAPEQARGEPLDARADLYAVGLMLIELLTGKPPFQGQSEGELLAQVMLGRVPDLATVAPSTPPDLIAVVRRLCALEVAARYANAEEAVTALRGCEGFPRDGAAELSRLVERLLPATPSSVATPPLAPTVVVTPAPPTGSATPAVTPWTLPSATPSHPSPPPVGLQTRLGLEPGAPNLRKPLLLGALCVGGLLAAYLGLALRASSPTVTPGLAPVPLTKAESVAAPLPPTPPPAIPEAAPVAEPDPAPAPAAASVARPRPVKDKGRLLVRVTPWASVEIDGRNAGTTPYRAELAAGKHRVILENRDLGKREKVTIEVPVAGEAQLTRSW